MRKFWARVSDLAICQRCPSLFGYKIHMDKNEVWTIGIKGKGHAYGSMFHKNIAHVFFSAAANSSNPLHNDLAMAVSQGAKSLEEFTREKIFIPFLEKNSTKYTADQILAAANAIIVWVKAMADFFAEIPSLKTNLARNMSTIFLQPEQTLSAGYDIPHEGTLMVSGRYDALLFNPDKAEARLFEFKGYERGDPAVPLSQSLMYAWLIEKFSGIVPSVEVIYLDEEEKEPDIFDPDNVRGMIDAGLPGLFSAAFHTITLRNMPRIVKDPELCRQCKYSPCCDRDWANKFGKKFGGYVFA